jgi:hypothetical protein
MAAKAQTETTAETLPFVPIVEFGAYGGGFPPSQATLTPQEELAFQDHVKKLQFPSYIFSGCRDRAHAAWLTLPAALRDKVSKVWVVAPSRHSASVKGVIRLMPNIPGSIDVRWGYHVALAYKNEEGMQVYDGGIAQGKVLEGDAWFATLRPDPLSFWTMTAGRIYMFYPTAAPNSTNKEIWGGNAHEYAGPAAAEQWIPVSLARDAVGEAILKNRECEVMKPEAKDPDALLERLKKGDVPAGCENLLDLFKGQKQAWIEKLK